jgi:multidrug efflux pump subunit AcrA (membrane-fusion protein)
MFKKCFGAGILAAVLVLFGWQVFIKVGTSAAESDHHTLQARLRLATAQVAQKEASLRIAGVRLRYTRIQVPEENADPLRVVGERFVDEGALLAPNTPIVSILKTAADEYGDPAAALFHQDESQNCMGSLLQNLRVAVRGVGCVGGMSEVPLLERIKTHEETFMRLKKDRNYRALARLITEWVDEAIKFIKFRC